MTDHKPQEQEARKVYDLYWESYLKGDVATFLSVVDEDVTLIGTAEIELCFNKAEILAFVHATIEQISGKVEMRERDIRVASVNDLVRIDEFSDMYVLIDNQWTFYAKIRLSTFLRQIGDQWKVFHQHGSFPDPRAQAGATIAPEQIKQENYQLREAIQRRTVELESKNRELAVEACLERVRTRAIAMKKPEDLLGVCEVLFKELSSLGFDALRNAMIDIYHDDQRYFLNYDYSDQLGNSITRIPYNIHPVVERHLKLIRGAHDAFEEIIFTGKELDDWKEFRRRNGEQDDPRLDQHPALYYYFYSIGLGDIGISSFEPIGEAKREILIRFRNVFDLAYRRFVDIEQAEAHAKEVRIELSLERVRARSLAMHRSDELVEASDVFFEQLASLGIEAIRTGVGTFNESAETIEVWSRSQSSGKSGKQILGEVPRAAHPFFDRCFEAWKNKEPYFFQEFNGDEVEAYYRHMAGVVSYQPASSYNSREVFYTFFFAEGSLNVVRQERLNDDELHIMQRFASVFGQIYRRFLDLKQAEAQTREAQIEAALERVRSRTMAMQRSDELIETSFVLFEQLRQLGEVGEQVSIGIIDDDAGTMEMFATSHGNQWKRSTLLPYNEHDVMRRIHRAWKEGKGSLVIDLSGDALIDYNTWRKQLRDIKNVTGMTFTHERWVIHSAFFSKGNLSFSTSEPRPPEIIQLLERFASVFDLTYTRFLDLKQAEAQTREAQIEAALERVRSRTMAMQKSSELSETSFVLFEQFMQLGEIGDQISIGIFSDDQETLELYATSFGNQWQNPRKVHFNEQASLQKLFAAWKQQQKSLVLDLVGEELREYNKFRLRVRGGDPRAELHVDTDRWVIHAAFFSKGILAFSTDHPRSEQVVQLLERFASVFDLTYTRFLDLKQAEAQAREATIEAALERVRSKAMAMRTSNDLSVTSGLVFTELRKLGITSVRCGVVLLTKQSHDGSLYFTSTSRESDTLAHVGIISLTGHPSLEKQYQQWLKQEDYLVTLKTKNCYRTTNGCTGRTLFPLFQVISERKSSMVTTSTSQKGNSTPGRRSSTLMNSWRC
ncbi:MAG: nuclear transport factor 2 family protein [bacterium]|nr:nuclear transport factor 2 family protein [bacterium]